MRQTSILFSTFLIIVAGALSPSAFAEWIALGQPSPTPAAFRVLESNSERTRVELRLSGVERETIMIQGREYSRLSVPEMSSLSEAGAPELPRIGKNLIVPQNANVTVSILTREEQRLVIGPVAPSKGSLLRNQNPEEVPYTFSSVYEQNQAFPETLGPREDFRMRDVRGVNLQLFPVRVNPVTGEAWVATRLVVEVVTRTQGPAEIVRGEKVDEAFFDLYRTAFANADRILPAHLIPDTGKMLIIADPAFTAAVKPLADWRSQRGMKVASVTTNDTGKTAAGIKAYVQKAYTNDKISYVLLVGDAEQVPTNPGTAGNVKGVEADPTYGLVNGGDSYPDLFVSRITAKTVADVENQVAKIVNYEKSPDQNGAWYSRGTGIASDQGAETGAKDFERANLLRDMMLKWHYTKVDQIYDPTAKKADISAALNEGRGYINYIGHGSQTSWGTTSFSNKEIDALTNGSKLPFIVSVACVNGNFAYTSSDSFAERWMKAGTAAAPKGAVAIFASSTNQSWVPPTVGQKAITELLTQEKFNTIGTLFLHGSVAVLEDKDSTADQTFQSWHIFGDAALQVRTKAPTRIQAQLPAELAAREQNVTLQLGEKGLTVALTQNGSLVGSGITDDNGNVTVTTAGLPENASALWTVTGFNRVPLTSTVTVR